MWPNAECFKIANANLSNNPPCTALIVALLRIFDPFFLNKNEIPIQISAIGYSLEIIFIIEVNFGEKNILQINN